MESKENKDIPYIVFESIMARMERTIKRLWVLCIILIALFVGSNLAWIYYESQFEYFDITQEVETGEGDAFVTGTGDINYGEGNSAD